MATAAAQPMAAGAAAEAPATTSSTREAAQPDVVIYNMEVSPHCQLVRSLLMYMKVPYYTVEVHPLTNHPIHEVHGRNIDDCPVIVLDGVTVAGIDSIIKYLLWWGKSQGVVSEAWLEQMVGQSTAGWTAPVDLGRGKWDVSGIKLSSRIEESIAWLEGHMTPFMWPLIAPSLAKAEGVMGYSHDVLVWEKMDRFMVSLQGAFWMRERAKQLAKKLGLEDKRAVKHYMHHVCHDWEHRVQHLPDGSTNPDGHYHGGETVDLADLWMYGVTRVLEWHEQSDLFMHGRFGYMFDAVHWTTGKDTRLGRIAHGGTRQAPRHNIYHAESEPTPLLWPHHTKSEVRWFLIMIVAFGLAPLLHYYRLQVVADQAALGTANDPWRH